MEEESVSVAWNWVIEALAGSDLVDAALLYELCPRILGDTDSGIAAREAAALTCLQALYPSPERDVTDSQFCLHPAQSCQHFLHRILLETGNLQKDASNDLKCSVQTFVNHKKASFPNSTLQLLKDIILQGNHSVFNEISGLVFGDQCGVDVPSSKFGHPMYPQSTSVKMPHPSETFHQQVITCNPASEINDQLKDVRIFNTSSGQSKTSINGPCSDNHMEGVDTSASPDLDNIGPPTKKLKLQNQCGNQTIGGESSEKIVGETFKENDHLPGESSDNGAAMSKAIFSGSQCVFSEDSVRLIDTEANICMKCNEGGRLLSCCGSTCPLHFHETCLGCFVSFDDCGDFYCPICAYSRAAADFVKAKERESLARKELALFIGGGSNDQLKHNHNKSSDDVLDQQIHENRENVAALQDDADAIQVAKSH
ncbi:uncharacterized protein LOC141657332 isoform X2 [Silene latifolia]|uniref:uncharacterized protein LOC141657332 isoform X2 n=1 Tax=Silene latifolia TaxID=37657 RepID=UPI003D77B9CC